MWIVETSEMSAKKTLRPKVGTILHQDEHSITTVIGVREDEDSLRIMSEAVPTAAGQKHWQEMFHEPRKVQHYTETHSKYICVNGPLKGQKKVESEAKDYLLYNRSRYLPESYRGVPKACLVYSKSLGPKAKRSRKDSGD